MSEPAGSETVIRKLRQELVPWCLEKGIRLAVLFGSRATGRARAGSDVDLAVWPAEPGSVPPAKTRLDWLGELTVRLDADVNLVAVTPRLDQVLGREIARDGRVLYEAEENLWAWERLRLVQLFNDALPFLTRQREALRRYAEEVRRGA